MTSNAGRPLPPKLEAWVTARKRHRLSHVHVQMARELGLNPNKLGSLDNHRQEPWKTPLPDFIEDLYLKRFGRVRPTTAVPIEQLARKAAANKTAKRANGVADRSRNEANGASA
ncbi:MAG TPA: hypothetical protein VE127_09395, partial [Solirubrobacteraceae bacterium]|nr:hypothetical protein [Solirubrobacteraceae bacterium]